MIENRPLTVPEVMEALRCKRRQVFRLLGSGVLERAPKYGKQTVITVESVRAALEAPAAQPAQKRRRTRPAPLSLVTALDALAERRREARSR